MHIWDLLWNSAVRKQSVLTPEDIIFIRPIFLMETSKRSSENGKFIFAKCWPEIGTRAPEWKKRFVEILLERVPKRDRWALRRGYRRFAGSLMGKLYYKACDLRYRDGW